MNGSRYRRARAWIATCLAASLFPGSSLLADEPRFEAKLVPVEVLGPDGQPQGQIVHQVEVVEIHDSDDAAKPVAASKAKGEDAQYGKTVAAETELPEYWLGVNLAEVPTIVRKHLKIKGGAIALDVVPESPAGKAGIQAEDILLEVEGTVIEQASDVLEGLKGAKGTPIKIKMVREGAPLLIEVTPSRRPQDAQATSNAATEEEDAVLVEQLTAELREIDAQLAKVMQDRNAAMQKMSQALTRKHKNIMLFAMRPGIAAQGTTPAINSTARLANGIVITVERPEKGPAKIVVEKEGKSWACTSDSYDSLPAELREEVKKYVDSAVVTALPWNMQGVRGTITLPHGVVVPSVPAMPMYAPATTITPAVRLPASAAQPQPATSSSKNNIPRESYAQVMEAVRRLSQSVGESQQRLEKQVTELQHQIEELRDKAAEAAAEKKAE